MTFRTTTGTHSWTFATLAEVVEANLDFVGADGVAGVLMDLGVSSHQLDESSRGFSFRSDAPLDLRMDPPQGIPAAQYLASADLHDFVRLLRANGDGPVRPSIYPSACPSVR